ncbi:MAG: hypothetical protein HDS82_05360 [Bacteroidales bacterium]|nr:hypothetical protein [Bacteroidales bacterium]
MVTLSLEVLRKCLAGIQDDPTTYDIMKAYLKYEEEDQYWSEDAIEMIAKLGEQNWLLTQL